MRSLLGQVDVQRGRSTSAERPIKNRSIFQRPTTTRLQCRVCKKGIRAQGIDGLVIRQPRRTMQAIHQSLLTAPPRCMQRTNRVHSSWHTKTSRILAAGEYRSIPASVVQDASDKSTSEPHSWVICCYQRANDPHRPWM